MLGPDAVSEIPPDVNEAGEDPAGDGNGTSCDLARVAGDGDGLFLGQPWEKKEPQLPPELLSDVTGLTTKTRAIQMVLGLDPVSLGTGAGGGRAAGGIVTTVPPETGLNNGLVKRCECLECRPSEWRTAL